MKTIKKECKDCEHRPNQLEWLDNAMERARSYSVVLIAGVIIIGILIIFGCSMANKSIPGLEQMNQFIGIVLGVVATIVSITSMLISFYGLEKTEESERRQHEILQQIIDIEKDTSYSTKMIEKSMGSGLRDSNVKTKESNATESDKNQEVDDVDSSEGE